MWCDVILFLLLIWEPYFANHCSICIHQNIMSLLRGCWRMNVVRVTPIIALINSLMFLSISYWGSLECTCALFRWQFLQQWDSVLPSFFTQHICLMIHEITKGMNFFASFCLSDSDYKWAKISRLRFRAVFTGRELLGTGSHLGDWAGVARFLF